MRASILSSAGAGLRSECFTQLYAGVPGSDNGESDSDVELRFGVVAQLVEDLDSPALGVDDHQPIAIDVELHPGGQREFYLGFKRIHPPTRLRHVRVALDVALLPLGHLYRRATKL